MKNGIGSTRVIKKNDSSKVRRSFFCRTKECLGLDKGKEE